MPWETRGDGHRYYYRAQRVGRRVIKTYVGAGTAGAAAAGEDARRRDHIARQRRDRREFASAWQIAANQFDLLSQLVDDCVAMLLLDAGYKCYSGDWRIPRYVRKYNRE